MFDTIMEILTLCIVFCTLLTVGGILWALLGV